MIDFLSIDIQIIYRIREIKSDKEIQTQSKLYGYLNMDDFVL